MKLSKRICKYLLMCVLALALCLLPTTALAAGSGCSGSGNYLATYNCLSGGADCGYGSILNCLVKGDCSDLLGQVCGAGSCPVNISWNGCYPQITGLDLTRLWSCPSPQDAVPGSDAEPTAPEQPSQAPVDIVDQTPEDVDIPENVQTPEDVDTPEDVQAPEDNDQPEANIPDEELPAQPADQEQTPDNNQVIPPVTPVTSTESSFAAEVVRLVNIERAAAGLAPLSQSSVLDQAAYVRAGEIITSFSHTRPDGSSCFTALQQAGARYSRAGENIAIGQTTPAQVVQAWMDSPGHRANIMNPDFTQIGVAARPSSGYYRGYAWAQFFTD